MKTELESAKMLKEQQKRIIKQVYRKDWGPRQFRKFVIFFSAITGILGLCIFGMVCYGYSQLHNFWNSIGSLGLIAFIFIALGMWLLFWTALLGFLGGIWYRFNWVAWYNVGMAFAAAAFLVVGIVTAVMVPQYFDSEKDDKCMKIDTFRRLQTYAESSQRSLCVSCDCYFPNSNNTNIYSTAQINYLQGKYGSRISLTDARQQINALYCGGWDISSYPNGHKPFTELEEKLSCSGWCQNTSSLFYRFTNINNGKPQGNCYMKASERVWYYAKITFILAFALAALCLISFLNGMIFVFGRRQYTQVKQPQEFQESVVFSGPQYGLPSVQPQQAQAQQQQPQQQAPQPQKPPTPQLPPQQSNRPQQQQQQPPLPPTQTIPINTQMRPNSTLHNSVNQFRPPQQQIQPQFPLPPNAGHASRFINMSNPSATASSSATTQGLPPYSPNTPTPLVNRPMANSKGYVIR